MQEENLSVNNIYGYGGEDKFDYNIIGKRYIKNIWGIYNNHDTGHKS